MPPARSASDATRAPLQARAARARERVLARIARARVALIAGAAAATCGLAVFIQSITPASSSASTHVSASGVPRSAQSLFGGGGSLDSGGSAPSASSGQGDAVSGAS